MKFMLPSVTDDVVVQLSAQAQAAVEEQKGNASLATCLFVHGHTSGRFPDTINMTSLLSSLRSVARKYDSAGLAVHDA